MTDIEEIINQLVVFRNQRDWEQFHNSKDLALAISVEANELLQLFLWKESEEADKRSWQNSLRALKDIFQHGNLNDHGIILEYQLPLTSKRLDCLICGKDKKKNDNAVIIELKQWEKCTASESENEVSTFVGGA